MDYRPTLRERFWEWRHRDCIPVMELRPEYRDRAMLVRVPHRKCKERIEAENELARQRADRCG